jgi:hypothetical protein
MKQIAVRDVAFAAGFVVTTLSCSGSVEFRGSNGGNDGGADGSRDDGSAGPKKVAPDAPSDVTNVTDAAGRKLDATGDARDAGDGADGSAVSGPDSGVDTGGDKDGWQPPDDTDDTRDAVDGADGSGVSRPDSGGDTGGGSDGWQPDTGTVSSRYTASISVHITNGQGCAVGTGDWIKLPDLAQEPVTTTAKLASAVDGDPGATHVTCSVKPSGSGFDFAASAESDNGNSPSIVFRVNGIAPGATDVMGSLAVSTVNTRATYQSAACKYSGSGDQLGVKAGAIWGTVVCDVVADENASGIANCAVDHGVFLFENCDQ